MFLNDRQGPAICSQRAGPFFSTKIRFSLNNVSNDDGIPSAKVESHGSH
jgi:hypothetical protein